MPRDAESRRRLLLISYWFPPAVGAAAERMASFARYLPSHDWNVDVLTAAHSAAGPTAGAPVAAQRATIHAIRDPLASTTDPPFADYDPRRSTPRWRKLARELVFPDRFRQWQRRAFATGVQLARQPGARVVLASFPPASAVQLALRVHEATGVPLALDFRDLWFGPGGYDLNFGWVCRAHDELRRRAIAAASLVVVISQAMADSLAAEALCPSERIAVIPNGYEPADLPAPLGQTSSLSSPTATPGQRESLPPPLSIAHVGTVIPRNRPDLFFHSLVELRRSGRLPDVRFRFVGNLSTDYIRAVGLHDVVETTGLVSREAARREMADADALLLLVGGYVGQWGHNAKLFEYLHAGRPILCLEEQPGSNDRRLLEQFAGPRSSFAALNDPAALAAAIEATCRFVRQNPPPPAAMPAGLEAYNRMNLAGRLAERLNSLGP